MKMRKLRELRPNIWTVGALRTIQRILTNEGKGEEYSWVGQALRKFEKEEGKTRMLALGPPERLALAAPGLALAVPAPEGTGEGEGAAVGAP